MPDNALKNAQWIWSNDEPERCNQYALFRREVELPENAAPEVCVCADMRYWLYVNGKRIGFGPGKFNPNKPLYDTHDIADYARPGRNIIALKVHAIGAVERCSSFIPKRGGLIAAVRWDGGEVVTDESWRTIEDPAYATDTPRFANHQSFIECFDARKAIRDWEQPGFDDSTWRAAVPVKDTAPWTEPAPKPVANLTLQPRRPVRIIETGRSIPPADLDDMETQSQALQEAERVPVDNALISVDDDRMFPVFIMRNSEREHPSYAIFDFGENAPGYLSFDVLGSDGTVVDIGYGEDFVYGKVRCNLQGVRYTDRFILKNEPTTHQLMFPKTLQYLLVEVRNGFAQFDDIRHDVSMYPVDYRGGFTAPARPTLQRVWQVGAHTVNMCMEDVYQDTSRRERAGWLSDMVPEAMAAYYAFGETDVARHSLDLYVSSQHEEGWVEGRYPSIDGGNMPQGNTSLAWGIIDHAMHSGDLTLAEQSWDALERLTGWFEGYRRDDDLVRVFPQARSEGTPPWGGYVLIDWAPMLLKGVMSGLNMCYVRYLDDCARLARLLGRESDAARYVALADMTRTAMQTRMFDDERGLFVNLLTDDGLSRRAGYQENLLALLWDAATPEQAARIADNLLADDAPLPVWTTRFRNWQTLGDGTEPWDDEQLVPIGSPFFMYYALDALFRMGRAEKALNTIESRYGLMLSSGSTSLWEDFSGDTSRSHGWSAGPTCLLGKYVLGVEPLTPGFETFTVLPTFGDLPAASGRVPTPHGTIPVAWERTDDGVTLTFSVPEGTTAVAGLPAADGALTCDGEAVRTERLALPRDDYDTVKLGAGTHRLHVGCASAHHINPNA